MAMDKRRVQTAVIGHGLVAPVALCFPRAAGSAVPAREDSYDEHCARNQRTCRSRPQERGSASEPALEQGQVRELTAFHRRGETWTQR